MVFERFFRRAPPDEQQTEEEEEEDEATDDSSSAETPETPGSALHTSLTSSPQPCVDVDVDASMALVHGYVKQLLDNRFKEVEQILETNYETDMHFALAYGAVITFQAIMTFDNKEVEKGYQVLSKGLELADTKRQSKTNYLRMRSPSYEEVVAELLYAETLLLTSILTFAQSDSVIAMIKGAVKGRTSYTIYKDLYNKYISKTKRVVGAPDTDPSKPKILPSNDFLSGILMGYGCFQIALAMVPPKLLKLLELVGLHGNTEHGLEALAQGAELDGLRSPFCAQGIIVYHTAFKFNLDPYHIDLDRVDALIDKYLSRHPDCVSFHFFRGRASVIRRDLSAADDIFLKCIALQNEWKTMHHTCWFELMWSSALNLRWDIAADYAERLFGASNWSKSSYLYLLAVFRYAHFVDSDPSRRYAADQNLTTLFKDVKEYQIRIAGKRLQIEKYCVRKARSFKLQNNFLYLPAIEALFVWGMFVLLDIATAQIIILVCEERLQNTSIQHEYMEDDLGLGNLMIGCLWKHCHMITHSTLNTKQNVDDDDDTEDFLKKSEEKLTKALSHERFIQKDHFVIAWANLELAELHWLRGSYERATLYLKACKKVSAKVKYSLESRIMFKMHNLAQRVKQIKPT